MTDRRAALLEKLAAKGGLRARINANCASCVYDPAQGGTWRKQVENCAVSACFLHPVRPVSSGGDHG